MTITYKKKLLRRAWTIFHKTHILADKTEDPDVRKASSAIFNYARRMEAELVQAGYNPELND